MDNTDNKLLALKPFEFNIQDPLIACVGSNGGTTNDSILGGFKSVVSLIIEDIRAGNGIEDQLIYPLVYSVRHCIELALKISINIITEIYKIKAIKCEIDEAEIHIHDIKILSETLKRVYTIDRRIPELFDLALKYAEDYYFDEKSDTFRYERNIEGKESLKELKIDHISISVLEQKFERVSTLFDDAIYYLRELVNEYSVGTWTKHLSRNDIEQLSKELLPKYRWVEPEFDENRISLRQKYDISGNELSKAIDFIKHNPLFASNIEAPIDLGSISEDEIRRYASLIAEFTNSTSLETKEYNLSDNIDKTIDEAPREYNKRTQLAEGISNEAMFTIAAFGFMCEMRDYYCENYQKYYDSLENDNLLRRDWLIRRIGTYNFALKSLLGMKWCGQNKYISTLKPLIDKIADDNNLSLRFKDE